jgi:ATP-dependent DNA helicase RecG
MRGRVGRGRWPGICFLCAGAGAGDRPTDEARARLALVAANDDGFALAEADLAQRGAGDLYGTRQAGLTSDLGPLEEIAELLSVARREAEAVLAADAALAEAAHRPLARAAEARSRTLFAGDAG